MNTSQYFDLDACIESYESQQARDGHADIEQFLPPSNHPQFHDILCELVRVDLEYSWQHGRPRTLDDYRERFPELFQQQKYLQVLTFEELRLRRHAGENPSPGEYQQRYGVTPTPGAAAPSGIHTVCLDTAVTHGLAAAGQAYRQLFGDAPARARELDSWCRSYSGSREHAELFRDVHLSSPQAANQLANALCNMPQTGTEFLGFQLIAELGHGAFARVFLAQQGELANRNVVLKITTDTDFESQTLAQLQHTNIVPIYSYHSAPPFQAVCMPYFGATTLHNVLVNLGVLQALPESGRGLVSTLRAHQSTVRESALSSRKVANPSHAEPTPADSQFRDGSAQSNRTLELLEQFTYVQAIVWIGAKLADGLAHAHERGVLHRDLKPANILLTDDGQPMLLDFNLAENSRLRGLTSAALIGGTLPYMAPEHLEAFQGAKQTVDARSDIYGLGVILFELLTLRQPFETCHGAIHEIVPSMIAERRQSPPSLRRWNQAVAPAVESIVRHCLEPDPSQRYQSAAELGEDLQRQLEDRPLKYAREPSYWHIIQKWRRRYARTATGLTVGICVILAVVLTGFGVQSYRQPRSAAAQATYKQFRADMRISGFLLNTDRRDPDLLNNGIAAARRCLAQYHAVDNSAWDQAAIVTYLPVEEQARLRQDVGEVALLLGRALSGNAETQADSNTLTEALRLNDVAATCQPPDSVPLLVWRQRASVLDGLGRHAEAETARKRAQDTPLRTARDRYLLAADHTVHRRFEVALALLRESTRDDPNHFWAWYVRGHCHDQLEQYAEASACYSVCIMLSPNDFWSYYHRALMHVHLQSYPQALADFHAAERGHRADQSLMTLAEFHVNRSIAHKGLKKYSEAIDDLTTALALGATYTRIYFMRAENKAALGDLTGARHDWDEGIRREPSDELSWVMRGMARLAPRENPSLAALERALLEGSWNLERALDLDGALADFQKALAFNPRSRRALQNKAYVLVKLQRTEEALKTLDQAISWYPRFAHFWSGRGVLRARLGRLADARADALEALRLDANPATLYQIAGIYALTSPQHPDDRKTALQLLTRSLRGGFGLNLIETDHDLDPLRSDPSFLLLMGAARAIASVSVEPAEERR